MLDLQRRNLYELVCDPARHAIVALDLKIQHATDTSVEARSYKSKVTSHYDDHGFEVHHYSEEEKARAIAAYEAAEAKVKRLNALVKDVHDVHEALRTYCSNAEAMKWRIHIGRVNSRQAAKTEEEYLDKYGACVDAALSSALDAAIAENDATLLRSLHEARQGFFVYRAAVEEVFDNHARKFGRQSLISRLFS